MSEETKEFQDGVVEGVKIIGSKTESLSEKGGVKIIGGNRAGDVKTLDKRTEKP